MLSVWISLDVCCLGKSLPAFYPLSTIFSALSGSQKSFVPMLNLLSANVLNLKESKICSFGKGYITRFDALCLTHYHTMLHFDALWKTL